MNAGENPFDLDNHSAYQAWRDAKLAEYPEELEDLIVEIQDPRRLTSIEQATLRRLCRRTNMAIYVGRTGTDADKDIIQSIGGTFGLHRLDHNKGADEDAISSLSVHADAFHRGYIPYTNRPIAWHTDGYYNDAGQQIHGLILHCVQPADRGGENDLLDHEILYIHLRDQDPELIRALMHPQAMTIPPNDSGGERVREAVTGPVFAVAPDGHLHMRYTDRSRSIHWLDDAGVQEAVARLKEFLNQPSPWHFRGKLQAGWGLLCNNVLHTRSGFEDLEHRRLLYRARYYDRIQGT